MNRSKNKIHESVFVAETAAIVGDVKIGEESSVWFNAVVRGDMKPITIGKQSNIQDCAVVHTDEENAVIIGDRVTVGHGAIVHGAKIGSDVLVGMGSMVLSGAVVGDRCIIGAGALVREKTEIPPNSIVLGIPGKVVGAVDEKRVEQIRSFVEDYLKLSARHKKGDF
jgi:carbonic anhydrase/acetyltransferase-like protein (isoleucine patch superfamily)